MVMVMAKIVQISAVKNGTEHSSVTISDFWDVEMLRMVQETFTCRTV